MEKFDNRKKVLSIDGDRIILRTLEFFDADNIAKHANNKKISLFTTVPSPYDRNNAMNFIIACHEKFDAGTNIDLGIILKSSNELIGVISILKINKSDRNASIGYWLGEPFWRNGFMSEALKLVLSHAFNVLDLVRVFAEIIHTNVASISLLKKFNFQQEGIARKDCIRHGEWFDHVLLGLLKEEYIGKSKLPNSKTNLNIEKS